jgi:hypothetical protein
MRSILRCFTALALLLALTVAARAERPTQPKKDATLIVTGTVQKVESANEKFGGDGVLTKYTAQVKVDKVEKGKDAKPGDTIDVHWFQVTKRPTLAFPGAYGHKYDVKEKAAVRVYLVKRGDDKGFEVIYNSEGIENPEKAEKK